MNKFIKMKNSYANSVGKGLPAVGHDGNPIRHQTRSIWFSREKLEYLLSLTDEREGGIRIFFAQYDEETLPEEYSHLRKELIGKLTLVLAACEMGEVPKLKNYLNGGMLCPPECGYDYSSSEISLKLEDAESV